MKKICTFLLCILYFSCVLPIMKDTLNMINEENHYDNQTKDRWFIKKADGRLGFIDSLGQEIYSDYFSMLGQEYNCDLVPYARDSNYVQKNSNKEYGFLNSNGEVVFQVDNYPSEFSEGLLLVRNNKKFVYLDTKGKTALSLDSLQMPKGKEIYKAFHFTNGLAMVIIGDIGFNGSHELADDMLVAEYINIYPQKWHYGFIDKKGKWKIKPTLTSATIFQDNISLIVKDGVSYFMNSNGDIISKIGKQILENSGAIYCRAYDYSEGFAVISEEGWETYINKQGKRVSDLKFQKAEKFSDGMACVQLNGKWGFINTSGQLVIDFQYYNKSCFSEGLTPVSLEINEKGYFFDSYRISGFIDKNGKVVIPFEPHITYDGFKNGITKGRRTIFDHNKRYTGKYELFYMKINGEKIWSEIINEKEKNEKNHTQTDHVELAPFQILDKQPEYPGGIDELAKFIKKNIVYPKAVKEKKIEGGIAVSFIIEKDGTVSNIELINNSLGEECGAEAIRVISLMPKWDPGQVNGKNVRTKYTIPVIFSID